MFRWFDAMCRVNAPRALSHDTVRRVCDYLPEFCKFWFVVLEKDGPERHAHVTLFPCKPLQRSNLITMLTRKCIPDWDKDEKANFRRWDANSKTGAVKLIPTWKQSLTIYGSQ